MSETGVARSEADPVHPDDVVDVRYSRSVSKLGVVVFLILVVLVFLLAEVIAPKAPQEGRAYRALCYGILLVPAAMSYLLRFQTVIRIDSQGVTSMRWPYPIRPTTVSWNDIFSCDLVVIRTPRGTVRWFVPVFKDFAGNDLFPNLTNLNGLTQADQRKVFRSLKSRFHKLVPDPWEP